MSNIVVDYREIIELIRREMEITRRSEERFSNIKLIIEDERLLAKAKDRDPDTMYIQVKFGAASTNFGIATLPFSLEVIGINQDVELTQDLLNRFVNDNNRFQVGNYTQFFLTPVVSQNNIPIYEGYRSLFIISATFVVGNNLMDVSLSYKTGDDTSETVECISYSDANEVQLNPQAYPNTFGNTKSYGSFLTFAFTIITYPDKSKKLIRDLYKWKYERTVDHTNDSFYFEFEIDSELGINNGFEEFKCKSADFNKKIGEQPVLTATFTL